MTANTAPRHSASPTTPAANAASAPAPAAPAPTAPANAAKSKPTASTKSSATAPTMTPAAASATAPARISHRHTPAPAAPAPGAAPAAACAAHTPTTTTTKPTPAPAAATRASAPKPPPPTSRTRPTPATPRPTPCATSTASSSSPQQASGTDGTSPPLCRWPPRHQRIVTPLPVAVTIRPSHRSRIPVTGGSSPPGHNPPARFPLACTSGRSGIAVHVEAPSALAAALASSAAQPRPPRGWPHPSQRVGLKGYVNPHVNPYVNPYVNPPAPDGVPGLAFGVGITAARSPCGGPVARKKRGRLAPLGGEEASALDPCGSLPAVWKPPSAAIDQSAVRLPHGALAISAHLRRAAIFDGDSLPPCRRSRHKRNVTGCHKQIVTVMLPGGSRLGRARSVLAVRVALIVTGRHGGAVDLLAASHAG